MPRFFTKGTTLVSISLLKSRLTKRTCTGFCPSFDREYSRWNRSNDGISSMHGRQVVAQKLIMRTVSGFGCMRAWRRSKVIISTRVLETFLLLVDFGVCATVVEAKHQTTNKKQNPLRKRVLLKKTDIDCMTVIQKNRWCKGEEARNKKKSHDLKNSQRFFMPCKRTAYERNTLFIKHIRAKISTV